MLSADQLAPLNNVVGGANIKPQIGHIYMLRYVSKGSTPYQFYAKLVLQPPLASLSLSLLPY